MNPDLDKDLAEVAEWERQMTAAKLCPHCITISKLERLKEVFKKHGLAWPGNV